MLPNVLMRFHLLGSYFPTTRWFLQDAVRVVEAPWGRVGKGRLAEKNAAVVRG